MDLKPINERCFENHLNWSLEDSLLSDQLAFHQGSGEQCGTNYNAVFAESLFQSYTIMI